MSEKSPKGSLPYGWIVKTSRHHPDRIYYFNLNTGVSTWECPELDPPRIISKEKDNTSDADFNEKNVINKSAEEHSLQATDTAIKSVSPPTAVVVPVVKQNELNSSVPISGKKLKRKRHSIEEANKTKLSNEGLLSKKKKYISPLNKPDSEAILPREDDTKIASVEMSELDKNASVESVSSLPGTLSSPLESENSIKDVEMQDVSLDLDNLTDKKDTEFDTSACYYIVIDTNVLIRELNLINELKDTPLDGCGPPHIFIPWVVIEELDKLKSQRIPKVSFGASEAIRYLNSVLSKNPRFHGQSPSEAEEWAKTYSKCNDDKILECCLGLRDKMPPEKVILLTNDKNLVNKAIICKVNVHNFESMMKKVKPDTKFHYEDTRSGKKKKKDKENEVSKTPSKNEDMAEKRALTSKRDICKREIHTIMSNARLLLKDVLLNFLSIEMHEAFGDPWLSFPIARELLKGLLEGILKYWRTVYFEFFSEKDKRNFELLHEKASRPEGFLGDKDECLVILSAIEDVFRQINRRRPNLNVPVEQIQDHRVACVNAFIVYCEAESSYRQAEDKSICTLLDDDWTVMNHICGLIMDHYKIPHDFDYDRTDVRYSDFEMQRIMVDLYPAVKEIKNRLCTIFDGVKKCQPVKKSVNKLYKLLIEFVPSLRLPIAFFQIGTNKYPFCSDRALERWLTCPQNRNGIACGIKKIEKFHSKLDEALMIIMRPCLINRSSEDEMICD